MPDTKPQPCPKCNAPATVETYHVHCSDDRCTFAHILFILDDWQCLRYVSEAAPKVRRMESPSGYVHYETDLCEKNGCQPVEAEQPEAPNPGEGFYCEQCGNTFNTPRQGESVPLCPCCGSDDLQDCRRVEPTPVQPDPGEGWRWVEVGETLQAGDELPDDSGEWCGTGMVGEACDSECRYRRRVEPAPVQPDPGEGWRLLQSGETIQRGDEVFGGTMWWKVSDAVGLRLKESRVGKYRRRVEPQAQGWEDIRLLRNGGYLVIDGRGGNIHTYAPSLRGFMGFVYEGSEETLCLHPCRWRDEVGAGAIEFPVAVRFEKKTFDATC